jgi:hypothetical protein
MNSGIAKLVTLGVTFIGGTALGIGLKYAHEVSSTPPATSDRHHPINLHNGLYCLEYGIVPSQYHNRFMPAFKYLSQYRLNNGVLTTDNALLSPLWCLSNSDVAILLAAALASQHAFLDYGELFSEMVLKWNSAQMRFVSMSDLMDNVIDSGEVRYTKESYEMAATDVLKAVTGNQEFRISRFIRDQAAILEKLLG